MLDLNAIIQGVASSLVTDKVKEKTVETARIATDTPAPKSTENWLEDIHEILIWFKAYLKTQQAVQGDLYKFIYISKIGFGSPYIPRHTGDRQNFQILGNASVTLNCVSSGLGTFNITTKTAPDWTTINYPDGSSYYLDATAPVNVMTFWERDTNAAVV